MDFVRSREPVSYLADTVRTSVKVVVVGPFGVGKTTFVHTLSEIRPLHTEETMSQAGAAVDDLAGLKDKQTTTVALDFGRLTITEHLVLYLFGAPGQQRFQQLWRDLLQGALGALVLADTRRLDQSFDVMGLLEEHALPYAVAVNAFPDAPAVPTERLRDALDLLPATPLVTCDARDRASAAHAMITLVDHLRSLGTAQEQS